VFDIYKKGQGYLTRMMTMIGGGVIILLGAYWLYEHPLLAMTASFPMGNYGLVFRAAGATLFIVLGGYLTFWLTYLRPTTGDFLIATEGEMKKVSWSSRKEIIGSTQVVVFTLVFMGTLLFVVDGLFMLLFAWMKVLKIPLKDIFSGGGA
jgi:preprotein translocase subunit SecE